MPLREQDTAIWIGCDDHDRPIGSSGKVRELSADGKRAFVSWGGGCETWCAIGKEVITPRQAANRGIEPWASAFKPRPNRTTKATYRPVSIFLTGDSGVPAECPSTSGLHDPQHPGTTDAH